MDKVERITKLLSTMSLYNLSKLCLETMTMSQFIASLCLRNLRIVQIRLSRHSTSRSTANWYWHQVALLYKNHPVFCDFKWERWES